MRLAALVLSFFFTVPALAQDLAPDDLVRQVTADVLDAIKSDKQLQAGDRKKSSGAGRAEDPPARRLSRVRNAGDGQGMERRDAGAAGPDRQRIPLDAGADLLQRHRCLPGPDNESAAGAAAPGRDRRDGAQSVPECGPATGAGRIRDEEDARGLDDL